MYSRKAQWWIHNYKWESVLCKHTQTKIYVTDLFFQIPWKVIPVRQLDWGCVVVHGLCYSPFHAFTNSCCCHYIHSRWAWFSLGLLGATDPQALDLNNRRGLLFTIISGFLQFLTHLSQVVIVHTPKTSLLLVVNCSYLPHMTDNEYKSQ